MTLQDNIRICLAILDEYSPDLPALTEDEDIELKIKILYNQPYQELSQLKKIEKVFDIERDIINVEHYTKCTLPIDVYQIKEIVSLDIVTSKPVQGDYYFIGKDLYINDNSHVNYKLVYNAYPKTIKADTEDFELEIDQDVQNILPYKVADNLLKSDPSSDYQAFRQAYEEALNKLDTRDKMPIITVENNYNI